MQRTGCIIKRTTGFPQPRPDNRREILPLTDSGKTLDRLLFKSAGSGQIPWSSFFDGRVLFANTLEGSLHLAEVLHSLGELKCAPLVVLLGNSRLEAFFKIRQVFQYFSLLFLGIVPQLIKEITRCLVGRRARIIQKRR